MNPLIIKMLPVNWIRRLVSDMNGPWGLRAMPCCDRTLSSERLALLFISTRGSPPQFSTAPTVHFCAEYPEANPLETVTMDGSQSSSHTCDGAYQKELNRPLVATSMTKTRAHKVWWVCRVPTGRCVFETDKRPHMLGIVPIINSPSHNQEILALSSYPRYLPWTTPTLLDFHHMPVVGPLGALTTIWLSFVARSEFWLYILKSCSDVLLR